MSGFINTFCHYVLALELTITFQVALVRAKSYWIAQCFFQSAMRQEIIEDCICNIWYILIKRLPFDILINKAMTVL